MARSSSLDSVPWDSLSVEVQEALLFRVPCHDLCRLRVVCKAWDRMISQPEFASLHAASTHRWPESCVLSTTRKVLASSEMEPRRRPVVGENDLGWELLDIAANRTYTIPDTFIREAMLRDTPPGTRLRTHTMAAGGGLIYTAYKVGNKPNILKWHRVVCNPVSRSFQEIPLPPGEFRNLVSMVVDAATQRYRIFNIRLGDRRSIGKVYLYDSWVRHWRKLCNAPGAAPHRPRSCVVLDGVLYAMFKRNRRYELYSCDLETGGWKLIDLALPRPPLRPRASKSRSQVVAAGGCLFFVGYSGRAAEDVITVTVWKIFALGESSRPWVTLVAQLPRFLTYQGLPVHWRKFRVVAAGCGDSIVVSNLVGRRVRWDVLRGTWYPMAPMIDCGAAACHSFFVSAIDLQMQPIDAVTTTGIMTSSSR